MISKYDDVQGRRRSSRDSYYMNIACQTAKKSSMMHKHGCIIVDSVTGNVVSTGYNKEFLQKHSNLCSLHAEIDAISKVSKQKWKSSKYNMYVVRLGENKRYDLKFSKPCARCQCVISKKTTIQSVFFSLNEIKPVSLTTAYDEDEIICSSNEHNEYI